MDALSEEVIMVTATTHNTEAITQPRHSLSAKLMQNITFQAGIGYVVSGGNPVGAAAGLTSGTLTTLGQWMTGKATDWISGGKATNAIVNEGVQLAGTAVNLGLQYAIEPANIGLKAAQAFTGYVAGKVGYAVSDKAQDAVGVPKNSVARPLVNMVASTAAGMAASSAVKTVNDSFANAPASPVKSQELKCEEPHVRQAKRSCAPTCGNTVTSNGAVPSGRQANTRYLRVQDNRCLPKANSRTTNNRRVASPIICSDGGQGLAIDFSADIYSRSGTQCRPRDRADLTTRCTATSTRCTATTTSVSRTTVRPAPVTSTETQCTATSTQCTGTSTETVTSTPDAITETVTSTPEPVVITATPEPVVITATPEPVVLTVNQTETETQTVTSTPEPVVITATPMPVTHTVNQTLTETVTATPQPVTVTETPEPVTVSGTATIKPVTVNRTLTATETQTIMQTACPLPTPEPQPSSTLLSKTTGLPLSTPAPEPVPSESATTATSTEGGTNTGAIVAPIVIVGAGASIVGAGAAATGYQAYKQHKNKENPVENGDRELPTPEPQPVEQTSKSVEEAAL